MKSSVTPFYLLSTSSLFAKPILATNKVLFAEQTRRTEKNVAVVSEAICYTNRTYTSYEQVLVISNSP